MRMPHAAALIFTIAAAGCSSAPPVESAPAPTEPTYVDEVSSCPVDGGEEITIELPTTTGEALMVDGLEHDRLWNNDLNGDGMPDMILQRRGACTSADECTVSVWVGCTPSTFTRVWGPDYAYELYVLEDRTDVGGASWAIIERQRPVPGENETLSKEILVFDGSSYGARD